MRKIATTAALSLMASPALAASGNPFAGEFWTLHNTNMIVLLAFILFVLVLFYFKVPSKIGEMLDQRSERIQDELNQARTLREEAQAILASYERKQKEVQEQADRIVSHARQEAEIAAEQAKEDLKKSIARRLAAAEDQIASAEASAVREVRDTAVKVAVAAAGDVVAAQMTAAQGNKLIDAAIADVGEKLH